MKKQNFISISTAFILAVVLFSCNEREPNVTKANAITELYPEEQEKIKMTLIHIFDLAKAKELDSLEGYHLYGPKFTKFDEGGLPNLQDAETAKKGERELFSAVSEFNYNLEDFKVDVFEDSAITTFIINVDFKMGGIAGTAKSRGTVVFVKVEEEWKITHEHFSAFISPPAQ